MKNEYERRFQYKTDRNSQNQNVEGFIQKIRFEVHNFFWVLLFFRTWVFAFYSFLWQALICGKEVIEKIPCCEGCVIDREGKVSHYGNFMKHWYKEAPQSMTKCRVETHTPTKSGNNLSNLHIINMCWGLRKWRNFTYEELFHLHFVLDEQKLFPLW